MLAMAHSRPSKATKKFESKHLARTIEKRRIQKRNKDKFNKSKARIEPRKAAAVQDEVVQKKGLASGRASLFDGLTMDEFLESGSVGVDNFAVSEPADDEMEKSHKAGLGNLKEKDPEFYEFLKQNDRELLEFDPDEMVEDEEEIEDLPIEGGLTVETLSKWEKLLIDEKSLGTLKKVLIAVKHAAANITGDELSQTGNTKYILTDPEGNPTSS